MAYTPDNPYIPGDPYSYDLKWIVDAVLTNKQNIESAVNDYISRDNNIIHDYESADAALSDRITALYNELYTAVDEWLTAHPEATTTVQDGSLTLNKFTNAAFAKILQKSANVHTVGSGAEYATIQDAYTQCVTDQGGTVLIMPGEYDEAVTMAAGSDQYQINFIGVSRDSVIWKSSVFGYANACFTGSGNLTFENLTMIKGSASTSTLGGYALHMDYPGMEGTMQVKNCHLISYENAALGCGTRTNQHIIIRDCLIENYKTGNTNTALLYHTAPEGGQTGQMFELINNIVIDHTSSGAAMFLNSAANTESFEPVFINNTFISGIFTGTEADNYYNAVVTTSFVMTNSTLTLTYNKCYGNNHPNVNASNTATPFINVVNQRGLGYLTTTPLNIPCHCGFWAAQPGSGVDTPNPSHDFIGLTIAFNQPATYVFSFAFDVNNGGKYWRFKYVNNDSGWTLTTFN